MVMLPLVSSITTAVIGRTALSKSAISCGRLLSRIWKSSLTRSGTRRPCASVTVTYSGTICVPDLNVGCWDATTAEHPSRMAPASAVRKGSLMSRA